MFISSKVRYTIKPNYSRKTYTIRKYDEKGCLIAKYRSYKQESVTDIWTENDIRHFLNSEDFIKIV